jgi:hypothetical protein
MDNLGGWDLVTMDEMEQTDLDNLMKSPAAVFLHLADGISAIVAEQDSSNDASEELQPILPHQLVGSVM